MKKEKTFFLVSFKRRLKSKGLHFIAIFLLMVSICNGQDKKVISSNHSKFNYSGFINKKNPVELNLIILEDNMVMGEINYLKQKNPVPIKLIGSFNVEAEYIYLLHEFKQDGNNGFIRIKFDNGYKKLIGEWTSGKSATNYPLDLILKDHSIVQSTTVGTYELEGLYMYNYGETGVEGTFKLTKEKDGTYAYSIIRTTNEINGNWATAKGTDLVIKDNQCIIEINKTCRFKVDFYDGFLRTSAMNENLSSCGFKGSDITLQATYVRIGK